MADFRLVAGLGNPGPAHAAHRHNIGFHLLDQLSDNLRIPIDRSGRGCEWGKGVFHGAPLFLIRPMMYMNQSGPPLRFIMEEAGISPEELILLHDDLDLVRGRIKIKSGGGHGGHNGIRSVMEALGTGDFIRVRLGIGRPAPEIDVVDHVLGNFLPEEEIFHSDLLQTGAKAVHTLLTKGVTTGMNLFNRNQS